MPSEERKQVLQLLADKKINAEQAYRLLLALGEIREGRRKERQKGKFPFGEERRRLRIRVTERGRQRVNIAIPLAVARSPRVTGIARHVAGKFGIDLSEVLQDIPDAAGTIVDVGDERDRVEVIVE